MIMSAKSSITIRKAELADVPAITCIYNEAPVLFTSAR